MTPKSPATPGATCVVLAFNGRNQLAVPAAPGPAGLVLSGPDPAAAVDLPVDYAALTSRSNFDAGGLVR